jgi:diaminopimelate decarboxylase
MEKTQALIERCFGRRLAELRVGGVLLSTLADRYGTPLFVYDRASLDARLQGLRSALPDEFEVYYSVKANPNLAIIAHFVQRGCGL